MTREDNILEKLLFLWQSRKSVLRTAALVFAPLVAWILLMSPVYVVSVSLFPKDGSKTGPSSALLGAVGLSAVQNVVVHRMALLLASEELAERTVAENGFLPVLYPGKWDSERKQWKKPSSAPTAREGAGKLLKMLEIVPDTKGMVTLSANGSDADFIARVVSAHLQSLQDRMREDARRDLQSQLAFLDEQMGATDDPLLRDRILALKATLIENSVYASASAFDLTETPRPPIEPTGPRRGLLTLVALILSLGLSAALVLTRRGIRSARETWKDAAP